MPNETSARLSQPQVASENAYRAFHETLSETAHGRAFLAEYARRNRNADTDALLAALTRLEARLVSQTEAASTDAIRQDLRGLLETIRSARPQIDGRSLPARAVKLAGLLDLLERRIEELANRHPEERASKDERPEPIASPAESARLAVVPPPDEPELPIPTPSAQPPAMALVPPPEDPNVRAAALMPEVSVFETAPAPTAVVDSTNSALPEPATFVEWIPPPIVIVDVKEVAAPVVVLETEPPVATTVVAKTATAPAAKSDPLAAIMALSDDECIALFT